MNQFFLSSAMIALSHVVLAPAPPAFSQCCEVPEVDTIGNPLADDDDHFGFSVSIDGTVFIAGTPDDSDNDDEQVSLAGSAFVYRFDGEDWTLDQQLLAGDAQASDSLGYSVSIKNDLAAAGAPNEDQRGSDAGAAYLFRYNSSTSNWTQEDKLAPDSLEAGDQFGSSVAVSGNVAIVGVPFNDESGTNGGNAGAAYIFRKVSGTWTQDARLVAPNFNMSDLFGWSVAIDGNVAVVGARLRNVGTTTDAGTILIYRYNTSTSQWSLDAERPASNPTQNAAFGTSVSVNGNIVIAGAPLAASGSGSAYVFRFSGGSWSQEALLQPCETLPNSGGFGTSVSVSGIRALVGAPDVSTATGAQGGAFVYRFDSPSWTQVGELISSTSTTTDNFGSAVSIGRGMVVAAAPDMDLGEQTQAGEAYTYPGFAPCECLGDLNNDDQIDGADLGILLLQWGSCSNCSGDLNRDAQVDGADLGILLLSWGRCGGDPAPMGPTGRTRPGDPEPVNPGETATMLGLVMVLGWNDVSGFFDWPADATDEEVHEVGQSIFDLVGN